MKEPKHGCNRQITAKEVASSWLVALLLGSGCSTVRRSASDVPPATAAALNQLHTGMTEAQARQLMQPVSLNWRRVPSDGSGPGELVFQISAGEQVRLALEPRHLNTRFWTTDMLALFRRIHFKPDYVVAYVWGPEPEAPSASSEAQPTK